MGYVWRPQPAGARPERARLARGPNSEEGRHLTARKRAYQIARVRKNLTRAVREAIGAAPCSERALARAAGVSNVTLVQLRQGQFAATPALARKLAQALDRWGLACRSAARVLRAAARRVPTPRTGRKS